MAMLTIGGLPVPSPSRMRLEVLSVGAGRRNALGEQVMDRTAEKRRLELGWARLTGEELEQVFGLAGGAGVFFQVTYPDGGQARAMTAFAEARETSLMSCENGVPVWTDVKIVLRER